MYYSWILILSIIGQSSQGPSSIATLGFQSKEACLAAGTAWLKQVQGVGYVESKAICVKGN